MGRGRPVIIVASDARLRRRTAALLAHYDLEVRGCTRAPACPESPALLLDGCRTATVAVGGEALTVARWSIEDLVHTLDVACRRLEGQGELHLALGRLAVFGPESDVRIDGRHIAMTRTERRLVRHLLRRPAAVHTRQHLVAHVWPAGYGGRADVVDTYVSYVRRKLADDYRSVLRTWYGAGYSLHTPWPASRAT